MHTALKNVAAILATTISLGAHATTIDFEASGTANTYNNLDYAIDGFVFNFTMDNIDIGSQNYSNRGPAHSGNFAALNNYGGTGIMRRADNATFSFQNVWFKGWANDGYASVIGFLGDTLVGITTFEFTRNSWQQISLPLANVDEIYFYTPVAYFLLDDITVNAVNAVPEPETYAMLLAGLGFMGVAARRRKPRA